MFLGLALGIITSGAAHVFSVPLYFVAPLVLLQLPSTIIINLPYNPDSLFAKDYEEERKGDSAVVPDRRTNTAMFAYLNFLYIFLYAYLGSSSIGKYYGDLIYVKLVFVAIFLLFIFIGYLAGRIIRAPLVHVYGQSVLPVAFLVFLLLVLSFYKNINFIVGTLMFAPMALLLGVLMCHSIKSVMARYDNKRRSTIFEFSILVLPVPIMISLSFVTFTNYIFYGAVCALMIMNAVIPAINIINSGISGYKKGLYFFISLFFIPLSIFMILYFRLSLDNAVYLSKTGNFEELRNVNVNASYVRNRATVTMDGVPVFRISDSIVRNYKRALVPISLFHPENKKMLILDSNQKFFRNPIVGYFKYSLCLDPVSDRDVDYNRLPYSGSQKYVPDNEPLLLFLEKNMSRFFTIVDMPNLFDQNMDAFRFSDEYYRILKSRLSHGGVYVQVLAVPGCNPVLFSRAVYALRRSFKNHIVFYFSNLIVVLASDDGTAFSVNQNVYGRLVSFLSKHEDLMEIFMNEQHVASHLLYNGLDTILSLVPEEKFTPFAMVAGKGRLQLNARFFTDYAAHNKKIFERIDRSPDQQAFLQAIAVAFQNDDTVLTLLKKTEQAESLDRFLEETRLLFELKKQAEYRIVLQDYIRNMLAYKEKYYYSAALYFEGHKKWEEARDLYGAVLSINPDNFNANYRLGLLSITLQDIEGSFRYLQQAMRINKNNPRVLFQMGVLYFSTGKMDDALDYFNKALQENDRLPQIYRYIGLCYERAGKLPDAERNYAKAILADPNDADTKSRLDEVRILMEKESKKWETPEQKNEMDVEQDADMPLPVSKGAYDIRLKDNESQLPVIDSATGDEKETKPDKK